MRFSFFTGIHDENAMSYAADKKMYFFINKVFLHFQVLFNIIPDFHSKSKKICYFIHFSSVYYFVNFYF